MKNKETTTTQTP